MRATFAGANIKGTPSMRASAVRHDLAIIKRKSHVFVVQEFKWPWYWRVANLLLASVWKSYPGFKNGLGHPVRGAQAIFWRKSIFRKLESHTIPAFDFKKNHAHVMDDRWMRAVLLSSTTDRFRAWFFNTHFVVGGDRSHDGPQRREFMKQNLARLDDMLSYMRDTGYPIMGEFDGNIHRNSWAYKDLIQIFKKHNAVLHGVHGIEYAFTIDGPNGYFKNVHASIIPTTHLKTDHEIRILKWEGIATS